MKNFEEMEKYFLEGFKLLFGKSFSKMNKKELSNYYGLGILKSSSRILDCFDVNVEDYITEYEYICKSLEEFGVLCEISYDLIEKSYYTRIIKKNYDKSNFENLYIVQEEISTETIEEGLFLLDEMLEQNKKVLELK